MNNRINHFYQIREVNPETGKEEYIYLTVEETKNGPVYIFTRDYEEAKEKLRNYARQRGYTNVEDLKRDSHVELDVESWVMAYILAKDNEDFKKEMQEYRDAYLKATGRKTFRFNFFDYINYHDEKMRQELERIREENRQAAANQGLLQRIKNKVKHLGVRTVAIATAAVIALSTAVGVGVHLSRKSPADSKEVSFAKELTSDDNTNVQDDFNENTADFATLLAHTKNAAKKNFMKNFDAFLQYFNVDFANRHSDYDKDTKLCLSTEETTALYLAYNGKNMSNDQLLAVFDQTTLDSATLIDQYKAAYLQMMLAATVQTEPTKMDLLIADAEGKEFYQKYENLNIAFNTATSEAEKKQIASEFVQMTIADFKLDQAVEGFEHDTLAAKGIKDYYSSVLPIVAAMYNKSLAYGSDYTFTEAQITELNGDALCDVAAQNINTATDRLMVAQQVNQEKTEDPSYANFMRAEQEALTKADAYHLDNRDISNTNIFKDSIPNGHIDEKQESATTQTQTTTSTETQKEQWSESTTETRTETTQQAVSREEAVQAVGEETVQQAEQQADVAAGIPQANQDAQQQAEQEADGVQEEQQAIEDQKGEQIDQTIKEENEKLEQDIQDMNDTIDQGGTATVPDDSNINIDDSYLNPDGSISGSVSDITTTPEGPVNEPLPDPNAMGDSSSNGQSDLSGVIIEEEEPVTTSSVNIDKLLDAIDLGNDIVVNPENNTIEVVPTYQGDDAMVR